MDIMNMKRINEKHSDLNELELYEKLAEFIKKTFRKEKVPNNTQACEIREPSYEEVLQQIDELKFELYELENENKALRWSLSRLYTAMLDWKDHGAVMEEDCRRLFDELEKLKNDK